MLVYRSIKKFLKTHIFLSLKNKWKYNDIKRGDCMEDILNKVLVVEDEDSIRKFISINLKRSGFVACEASTGEEALKIAEAEDIDAVILDIMLPGIDGFHVCETLRKEHPSVGIIMLTARSQDMDKIMGLEYGADDYMIKPFNPMELILRLKALLRRINGNNPGRGKVIESHPFKIDLYCRKVYKNELELDLTPTEYMLLKIFIENQGKAFTRDDLLNKVWGYEYVGDTKIVDVNIRRLRAKIEDDPSKPVYIETIWGTGYRWNKII